LACKKANQGVIGRPIDGRCSEPDPDSAPVQANDFIPPGPGLNPKPNEDALSGLLDRVQIQ
jgi:hypothetical protein